LCFYRIFSVQWIPIVETVLTYPVYYVVHGREWDIS
jgi:hypothetical protein